MKWTICVVTFAAFLLMAGCSTVGNGMRVAGDVPRVGDTVYVIGCHSFETTGPYCTILIWYDVARSDDIKMTRMYNGHFTGLSYECEGGKYIVRKDVETRIGFVKAKP